MHIEAAKSARMAHGSQVRSLSSSAATPGKSRRRNEQYELKRIRRPLQNVYKLSRPLRPDERRQVCRLANRFFPMAVRGSISRLRKGVLDRSSRKYLHVHRLRIPLPCLIPQAGRKNEVLRPVQGDTRVAEKTSPSSVKASIEKKLVKALSLKQESGDEVVRGAKLRRKSDSSFSALSNSELEDYLEQGSRQSVRPIRIDELGVLDEGMKPPQRGRPPKGRRQHERVVLQDQDDLFEEEDWMESPPPRKGGRQQAPQRGRRAVPDEDEDRTFGSQRQRRLENDACFASLARTSGGSTTVAPEASEALWEVSSRVQRASP